MWTINNFFNVNTNTKSNVRHNIKTYNAYKIIIICILFILLYIGHYSVVALSENDNEQWNQIYKNIENILDNIDLSALEKYIAENSENYISNFGSSATEIIIALLAGNTKINFNTYVNNIFLIIFNNVIQLVPIFACIIAIAIINAIFCIQTTQKTLLKTANDTVKNACILLTITILSTSLISIINQIFNCANSIKVQAEIITPILLTLTVLVGGSSASAIFQPTAIFLSSGAIDLVANFVFPVTISVIIFNFLSRINMNMSFLGTSKMIKSVLKWIIGITATVYGIFLGVQGNTASIFDGILFKATKYLLGNSVPIVGNFLSGGVDLLSASGALIRSSVGLSGIIMLIFIIGQPIISLLAFSLMLKITAAIIQPLGDLRLYGLLSDLSNDIEYFIAGLLMVAFMYILLITSVINSANYFI